MSYTALTTTEIATNKPVTNTMLSKIRNNEEYFNSQLNGGQGAFSVTNGSFEVQDDLGDPSSWTLNPLSGGDYGIISTDSSSGKYCIRIKQPGDETGAGGTNGGYELTSDYLEAVAGAKNIISVDLKVYTATRKLDYTLSGGDTISGWTTWETITGGGGTFTGIFVGFDATLTDFYYIPVAGTPVANEQITGSTSLKTIHVHSTPNITTVAPQPRNQVIIRYFDEDKVDLAADETAIDITASNPTTWTTKYAGISIPATAKYYKIKLVGGKEGTDTIVPVYIYFDNVVAGLYTPALTISGSANTTPVANTIVKENIVKAWVSFDADATPTIYDSYNVSGVAYTNPGDVQTFTITWITDFANTNYLVNISTFGNRSVSSVTKNVGTLVVVLSGGANPNQDVDIIVMGSQ